MASVAMAKRSDKALLEAPENAANSPESPTIVQVARKFGISPLRQMRETLALRYGPQKLQAKDYYEYGLYAPGMSMAEKRTYVGITGNNALNARLSPPALIPTGAFVANKVLYTALLAQLGLATTETQGVASATRRFGELPVFRDAAAVVTFLTEAAQYPVFGKPCHGSRSEGSVRLESLKKGILTTGNGRYMPVTQFADEVMSRYPGGFNFQTALKPHPKLAAVSGTAVGCVRVVTVADGAAPRAVYALWKIPAPDAMSDNFWQAGSMLADLNLAEGRVKRCQRGTGLAAETIDQHPVTDAPIIGRRMPCWSETLALAEAAHAVFPEFGVCGWDIAITPDGPAIIECNDNPMHTLYQLSTGRGIWNAELAPVWEKVAARQAEKLARMKAIEARKARGG